MEDKITYGVFDMKEERGEIHSVPLVNHLIMPPHTLSEDCPCNPTVEQYLYKCIIHNMIH